MLREAVRIICSAYTSSRVATALVLTKLGGWILVPGFHASANIKKPTVRYDAAGLDYGGVSDHAKSDFY